MANILVIGGSYFFGRWFVQYAYMTENEVAEKEDAQSTAQNVKKKATHNNKLHTITVINRGNVNIDLPGVVQYKSDRHDLKKLQEIKKEMDEKGAGNFDCIVDFCAYDRGDVESIASIFGGDGCRYIFISTVDVYEKKLPAQGESIDAAQISMSTEYKAVSASPLTEDSPLEKRMLPGEVGEYISKKAALETELIEICQKLNMINISVRPAILYGPANYAPRESMYFEWINKAGQIITPIDSTGQFQFVYVADAAKALCKLCEMDPDQLKSAYNFCTDEICTYDYYAGALHESVPLPFEEVALDIADIFAQEVPLPFPLTDTESQLYDSKQFMELIGQPTSLVDGLKAIYNSFYASL